MNTFELEAQFADIPREKTLCFTGHRPEKLPVGETFRALQSALCHYIVYALHSGFTHFLTGMADGIDYYAAHALFIARRSHPDIRVIGVQPCQDYLKFYQQSRYDMEHLQEMLDGLDKHIILPGTFRNSSVFLTRNKVMVDHSSGLIAVCTKARSGSLQTLNYAKKQGLAYCWLHPFPPEHTLPSPLEWPIERCGF